MVKATKMIGVTLAVLLLPCAAVAETWQTLDASNYPAEMRKILDEVRVGCKEAGQQVSEDSQAGVTIIDLDRDGSRDILLDAWRVCDVPVKGGGACNTAGCDIKIFKQLGQHKWKLVFKRSYGLTVARRSLREKDCP
jgi:hypothetical protein